ncbi:MAG: hypothetical protein ACR2RV_10690 [Verrucomicrobiales bacterium]
MSNLLKKKPWLWIVLAFILLIAAWAVLITIAVNNQPESIEVEAKEEAGAAAEVAQ